METVQDLLTAVAAGQRPVVTFERGIEELDDIYPEAGMRARIVACSDSRFGDGVIDVQCAFNEFEAHNMAIERPNYYDKDGNPRLTAHQAGQYKPEQTLYLMATDPFSKFMSLADEKAMAIYAEWAATGKTGVSYVQWLEQQLGAAREALGDRGSVVGPWCVRQTRVGGVFAVNREIRDAAGSRVQWLFSKSGARKHFRSEASAQEAIAELERFG